GVRAVVAFDGVTQQVADAAEPVIEPGAGDRWFGVVGPEPGGRREIVEHRGEGPANGGEDDGDQNGCQDTRRPGRGQEAVLPQDQHGEQGDAEHGGQSAEPAGHRGPPAAPWCGRSSSTGSGPVAVRVAAPVAGAGASLVSESSPAVEFSLEWMRM